MSAPAPTPNQGDVEDPQGLAALLMTADNACELNDF
jgi:hypothetical protein